jgi:hypothetical protein
MICSEGNCGMLAVARGLCSKHYGKWRRNRPGRCRYCGGALLPGELLGGADGETHERCLTSRRELWHTYRRQILEAYGARCACCGETREAFLTIDHVHGDGYSHRKALGFGNRRVMLDIIGRGFPPEFQILCYNCNCGRQRNGGVCPHLVEAEAIYEAVLGPAMVSVQPSVNG